MLKPPLVATRLHAMASSLVPPPRLAADVLSLPETKQTNEEILNGMLGANPTAGEQLADEAQASEWPVVTQPTLLASAITTA